MTKNTKNPTDTTSPETALAQNPFEGMADQNAETLPATFNPDEYRALDPAYILGRQMLALDDIRRGAR